MCIDFNTVISVIIGGAVTWICSLIYYMKAGKQLKDEAKYLRKLMDCMIVLQQDKKGQYKPRYDDEGNLLTVVGLLSGTTAGNSSTNSDIEDGDDEEK